MRFSGFLLQDFYRQAFDSLPQRPQGKGDRSSCELSFINFLSESGFTGL
jgi:hypothetical protein